MKLHGGGSNHQSCLSEAMELSECARSYLLGHTMDLSIGCVLKLNILFDLNKLLRTIDFPNFSFSGNLNFWIFGKLKYTI